MSDSPVLRAQGLVKVYGTRPALSDVSLALRAGEVRALVGSNGAGKSTLVKILTGAVTPTGGTVEIGGRPAVFGNPRAALQAGIACIYQHSNLAPAMSVLDNIFLGRQPTRRGGLLDRPRQRREAQALLARHDIDVDLDVAVGSLSTVKQKEVEILKALALDARVLLMDEPTAWLSADDVARLYRTIRSLKARGVGIVYISHVLDEIFAVCDTYTVLRDGCVVADGAVPDITRAQLVQAMVGSRLARQADDAVHVPRARETGPVRLRCSKLGRRGVFQDVSFEVHAGEILCITGLIGARRTELLHAIFGSERFDAGELEVDGRRVTFRSPREAMAHGIGFVPEDRHRDGLMLGLSVGDNLVLPVLDRFRAGLLLAIGRIREAARRNIQRLGVRPTDPKVPAGQLSGGNQQKVLLGKWLNLDPRVLLLDEPTVGVDVGAKSEIYDLLRAERDRGVAILVVSSDLEEVTTLADRVAVMAAGRLVSLRDASGVGTKDLLRDMGGLAA